MCVLDLVSLGGGGLDLFKVLMVLSFERRLKREFGKAFSILELLDDCEIFIRLCFSTFLVEEDVVVLIFTSYFVMLLYWLVQINEIN